MNFFILPLYKYNKHAENYINIIQKIKKLSILKRLIKMIVICY